MSFGEHIQALRLKAGLSRAELARRASVPMSTLRNGEANQGFPGQLPEAIAECQKMLLLKPDDKAGLQLMQSLLAFQEGQHR